MPSHGEFPLLHGFGFRQVRVRSLNPREFLTAVASIILSAATLGRFPSATLFILEPLQQFVGGIVH